LPLQFEANQGQADQAGKFLSHGSGYNVLLTADEAVLVLAKPELDAKRDARNAGDRRGPARNRRRLRAHRQESGQLRGGGL
jgi:hypothetical protein